ncbi:hypothetical protein MBLNU459_g6542t1 [Dothideomycetes sp. NU459]
MKAVYTSLGFALGASAALISRDHCCFSLTASGGKSGVVGQLGDGQNRIGQMAGLANTSPQYCINNGAITDGSGRGCILTPPTTQFQCDMGASPTSGFSVNSNGDLAYNGNTKFIACDTGDNGGYNIYTTAPAGQTACVDVTLNTGGQCLGYGSSSASAPAYSATASSAPASVATTTVVPYSSAPASVATTTVVHYSTAPASTVTATVYQCSSAPASVVTTTVVQYVSVPASSAPMSSAPATKTAPASNAPMSSAPATKTAPSSASGSGTTCATSLTGAYQTPHAIIPINKESPDTAYGTQYNAYISSANSTIFNFDIPASYSGKQCTVLFLFPEQSQLETSSFTQSGSGGLTFSLLSSAANQKTCYSNAPSVSKQLDSIASVAPGNSYVVSTYACAAGTTQSIEVSSTGGYGLEFFEDWNPSPIGLFMTSC